MNPGVGVASALAISTMVVRGGGAAAGACVIDIHCHLLPGVDDGPPTMAAALQLAQALVADGITHVMATPHVFPGMWNNTSSNIGPVCERLRVQLAHAGIPLQISWAGEVRLMPEALDLLDQGQVPLLGHCDGDNLMLLEMPDAQIPIGADRFVAELRTRGVRPVLVHPERNKGVMANPERLRPFMDQGCLVQVTAGSLVGQFGATAQKTAEALLERQWVNVVASDAHNLRGRLPRMRDAREWLRKHLGEPMARRLTWTNPRAMTEAHARPAAVERVPARASR